MEKAASNLATAAIEKFSAKAEDPLHRLVSWVEGKSAVRFDGLTLEFAGYGDHITKAANIVAFIHKLEQKLAAVGQSLTINIHLDLDASALSGQSSLFKPLKSILLQDAEVPTDDVPSVIEKILVFIPEPTSNSKKALRRKVEDEFQGADRKAVLRKIIAVISPHGHGQHPDQPYQQFTDDLIYFQDNFDGVGMWPLPLDTDAGVESIKSILIDLYSDDDSAYLGESFDNYIPWICEIACPNRWWLRLSFDLLAGLLFIYAVLAIFWVCRLRTLYKNNYLYFLLAVLVTIAIGLISLVCDPYWEKRAGSVVVWVGFLLGVYTLWTYVRRMKRPPLP